MSTSSASPAPATSLPTPTGPVCAQLIDDVDTWRRDHGIDPADSTILGPRPTDPIERAQHDDLTRQLERRDPTGRGRSVP